MNTYKPGMILAFRGDQSSLYLVCKFQDAGFDTIRLVGIGPDSGHFNIGPEQHDEKFVDEHFTIVANNLWQHVVQKIELVNNLYGKG